MSSKNEEEGKPVVITIGRLQPPHKGHDVLIRDTVQLARDLGGDSYVWISPSRTDGRADLDEGEVPERTESDPLSTAQRFYYLNKMYPITEYPDVKFLYDMDEGIKLKTQGELNALTSTLEVPTRGRRKKPYNWKKMTLCQKYKYVSIMEDGRMFKRAIQVRDRAAGVRVGGRRLPSAQCLNWLKSRGYTKVILLVGSDRVEAFKTYNQELGDKLFKKFKVDQSGYDRGGAGRQELKPLKLERALSDESIDDLSQMMSGLSISPAEQRERAEEYSGTRTRNAAIQGNIPAFVRAVKEGNMTMLDCFCLCNDVRTRGMPSLSDRRIPQRDFLAALPREEERLEFYQQRNKIKSFESGRIRDGFEVPDYSSQTPEEVELYGEEYNPFRDSDLDLGGGRRRKTRKKRRKRRKKTRKKKKKKRKTRRKRRRKRKTKKK